MAVVVPAVLTDAPDFGPVRSSSTPVFARSDREAGLASIPDLPPPRA
jgi:hypothetical protein